MRARDISHALNYIDDDLIKEAADLDVRKKRKAKVTVIRIGAIAAAAVALITGWIFISKLGNGMKGFKSDHAYSATTEEACAEDAMSYNDQVDSLSPVIEAVDGGDSFPLPTGAGEDEFDGGSYAANGGSTLTFSNDNVDGGLSFETTTVPILPDATEADEEDEETSGDEPRGPVSELEETYEFIFNGTLYVTSYEEADEDHTDDLVGLGQAESGEDIYADPADEDNILIDIDGVIYIASVKE